MFSTATAAWSPTLRRAPTRPLSQRPPAAAPAQRRLDVVLVEVTHALVRGNDYPVEVLHQHHRRGHAVPEVLSRPHRTRQVRQVARIAAGQRVLFLHHLAATRLAEAGGGDCGYPSTPTAARTTKLL